MSPNIWALIHVIFFYSSEQWFNRIQQGSKTLSHQTTCPTDIIYSYNEILNQETFKLYCLFVYHSWHKKVLRCQMMTTILGLNKIRLRISQVCTQFKKLCKSDTVIYIKELISFRLFCKPYQIWIDTLRLFNFTS